MTDIILRKPNNITKMSKKSSKVQRESVFKLIIDEIQRPNALVDDCAENVWIHNKWIPFDGISNLTK